MTNTCSFLDIASIPSVELRKIVAQAEIFKTYWNRPDFAKRRNEKPYPHLSGKTLAMIFELPSTRTRISFDIAMRRLGGSTLILNTNDLHLGRGESIADTARVMSRYVDGVMIRTLDHEKIEEFSTHASVPVINGLSREAHPCQAIADLQTMKERLGAIENRKVVWLGDVNNVIYSLIEARRTFDFHLTVVVPAALHNHPSLLRAVGNDSSIRITADVVGSVRDVDVLITDTWSSMGDENALGLSVYEPFRIDGYLLAQASPQAILLHCLPAKRGMEVTDEVLDGPQSAVWDEAENRIYAQMSIIDWCFSAVKEKCA